MLFSPVLFVLTLFVPLLVAAESTISQEGAALGVGTVFEQLTVGTIILIVSWIMDVGRELREEQDLVV
jgi:nucleoside recognition membrane protein YjiH